MAEKSLSYLYNKHSNRLLFLAFLSHKHQFNFISDLPPTCSDSTQVKVVCHDPSRAKHSIVTRLLIIKCKTQKHIKTAKALKIPQSNNLTCSHESLKCHHVFGHKQCDMVTWPFLPCSNNELGFAANCICFPQDLCLICCRIWKINDAQKLLKEDGLTLRQLKASQKNLVPILAYARAPSWCHELFKGSLWGLVIR